MHEWKELKWIAAPDQREAVSIMEGPDGLFSFHAERWIDASEIVEGVLHDGYWASEQFGLYQSAAEAEQDARRIVPWLRDL